VKEKLSSQFMGLKVVGTLSPLFRQMNEEEENVFQQQIKKLSPDII